jgi:hypothetical protein
MKKLIMIAILTLSANAFANDEVARMQITACYSAAEIVGSWRYSSTKELARQLALKKFNLREPALGIEGRDGINSWARSQGMTNERAALDILTRVCGA